MKSERNNFAGKSTKEFLTFINGKRDRKYTFFFFSHKKFGKFGKKMTINLIKRIFDEEVTFRRRH